jgi:hypothetical protein
MYRKKMSRGLPLLVKDNLTKCRLAAFAAVEAYNRPGRSFRTAQFLVMITIACILDWLWICKHAPAGPVSPDPR